MKFLSTAALAALAAFAAFSAAADEGMWTFDNPPAAAIEQKYGVKLDSAWLNHVRESTVRLETGCTGSFISGDGLILTNHHCAEDCVSQISSEGHDLNADGFLAGTREKEVKCEEDAVSVLVGTEDVTAKVAAALAGVAPDKVVEARRAALTKLEQACEEESKKAKGGALKCERVALYQGGQHWLYKYRRYDDVRLVFVPERDIAAFGGDPDNFQFPRWCLDMSILRAYENGKPARTANHLRFNWAGAQPGDPVFVSGHPGDTDRLLTTSQLALQRDTFLPFWLLRYSELRGRMIQYSKTGDEPRRTAESYLNQIENSIKVRRKQFDALLDPALLENAAAKEKALRDSVAGNASLASASGAWDEIAKAQDTWRNILVRHAFLEALTFNRPPAAFNSDLFVHARVLVRAAAERAKPNETRLPEFTEARLSAVVQSLKADAPIYPDFEVLRLSFGLERMREWLGPDDLVVRRVFGNDSPDTLANRFVRQSSLGDAVRARCAVRGRAGRDRREPGPDDPPRRRGGSRRPRAAQAVRGRGRWPDGPRPGGDREGEICRVRHEHLPRRDFHAAPLLRRDERLGREGPGSPAVDRDFTRLRACDRRAAVQDPAALDGREGPPRHDDAGELHDRQRHRRRQLRQPDAECEGRDRGPCLRRQHPLHLGQLLVRRADEPLRRRAPGLHPGRARKGLRREGAARRNRREIARRGTADGSARGREAAGAFF